MLPNREYLELEEISLIEGISRNDFLDLFRRKKINLYLWCSEPHLIGQVRYKGIDKPFTAGNFSYSGVVQAHHTDLEKLVEGQTKLHLKKFIIMELDQITNWSPEKPSRISYPNKQFTDHKALNSPPKFSFHAFINGEDSEKKHGNLLLALDKLQKSMEKDEAPEKDIFKPFKDYADNQVSITPKVFTPSDLRFSKSEVLSLITQPQTTEQTQKPITRISPSNPLDALIVRVAQSNPGRSDQIWNLLRIESRKEILDREYDQDGILEAVSQTELIWRHERIDQEKKLGRESFKNKYSKLKKNYEL